MNTAEQLPVPRAERITHYPNDGHWAIISEGDRRFVADENSLRKIPPETMWGGWTPVAHVLALIESAKLREELAEARKQGTPLTPPALEFIRGCRELLGFVPPDSVNGLDIGLEQIRQWKETHAAPDTGFCDLLGIARGSGWPEAREAVLALQRENHEIKEAFGSLKDRYLNEEAGKAPPAVAASAISYIIDTNTQQRGRWLDDYAQLDHLAQFIGHPGTTAAHVVTETVSLIEKFCTGARLIGVKDAKPCSAAETFVAKMRQTEEVTVPARLRFAEFLGSKSESWSELSEEAIKEMRTLGEQEAQWKTRASEAILGLESWKSRALAAESQLAGPPDEKPVSRGYVVPKQYDSVQSMLDVITPEAGQRFRVQQEARNWEDSAAQFLRDSEFYQGIIDRIGLLFGEQAFIADDGSRQEGILRLKVPELCERLMLDFRAAEATVAYLRGNRQPVDLKG